MWAAETNILAPETKRFHVGQVPFLAPETKRFHVGRVPVLAPETKRFHVGRVPVLAPETDRRIDNPMGDECTIFDPKQGQILSNSHLNKYSKV